MILSTLGLETSPSREILTADQVAGLIGRGTKWQIEELARRGLIPALMPATHIIRFRESRIRLWLELCPPEYIELPVPPKKPVRRIPALGFVYCVESLVKGRVKIGFSIKPELRLNSLRGAAGEHLRLRGYWPGTVPEEKEFHEQYKEQRIQNEWFRSDEAILRAIDRRIQDWQTLPLERQEEYRSRVLAQRVRLPAIAKPLVAPDTVVCC